MAEGNKTLHILFRDGKFRTFTNVSLDTTQEGWLYITHLEVQEAPLSGIVEPLAGYRLDALVGWEYEEAKKFMVG